MIGTAMKMFGMRMGIGFSVALAIGWSGAGANAVA